MLLTEKYRPASPSAFIGLDKAKKLCAKLASSPFDSSWLFVGASGTGKTTIALALAEEMQAELIHIPSQSCTVEAIKELKKRLAYRPAMGKRTRLVLVDEADQMSPQAQLAFLSLTDGTARPEEAIIIFTCNETERLESRFLSRQGVIEFSSYGLATDAAALLARIWENEAPPTASAPNFARIVKDAKNNIRASLMELQKELMLA